MLQSLYARAKESQTHGAIHDDTAVRLVQQLDYNFDFSSKDAAMHNGVIARALVLDKLVSTYLAQHPGAVVNITCRASAALPLGSGSVGLVQLAEQGFFHILQAVKADVLAQPHPGHLSGIGLFGQLGNGQHKHTVHMA